MQQIINMVIRQVMRRLINMGIDKGVGAVSKRAKPNSDKARRTSQEPK